MRLIDADALYKQVMELEELARNRVRDTESTMPYQNNLNPSYTRYLAQMDERTKMKHIIAYAPTISSEPHWIPCSKKLPEAEVEVFVYLFDRPSPYIAWITKDGKWHTEDFEVEKENYPTEWMPLPEPYRRGGENE